MSDKHTHDSADLTSLPDRRGLRLPATLTITGLLGYVAVTAIHTGGPANDHPVIFGDYAGSQDWLAVHVGQFAAMAVMLCGLMALRGPLSHSGPVARHLARLGATLSAIALGLYAVLQAVDGVALKHAVDAWVAAPADLKPERFAAAETVRWLEWGTRSMHTFTLGAALLLLGAAVIASRRLSSAIGALIVLSAAPALTQGWVLGSAGFTDDDTIAILVGYALTLAWAIWLAVVAWVPTTNGHAKSLQMVGTR